MFNSTILRVLFFLVPALMPFLFFAAEHSLPQDQIPAFYSEAGPVEFFQEAVLLICLIISIYILCWLRQGESKWLKIWMGIASIACFYVFIEEISWGQKFFQWETPEGWAEKNTQGETNIHNAYRILNHGPRTLLEIAVLAAGVIIPALMKWAPSRLPARFNAIYPPIYIAFAGIVTLIVKLLEQSKNWFGVQVFYRKSEVMETFLYYFVFLYLISLFLQWRAENRLKD